MAFISLLILMLSLSHSTVTAARCQISNVSYSIPEQAGPSQQIESSTNLTGSCESNGEDYYSVRVDLAEVSSGSIVSSNSTPIGYNATDFNSTVENFVTTPSSNGTWSLNIYVYVIRAGGTAGSYLLDYRNSTTVSIQVGESTPVPEFPLMQSLIAAITLSAAMSVLRRRKRPRASNKVQRTSFSAFETKFFRHLQSLMRDSAGQSFERSTM